MSGMDITNKELDTLKGRNIPEVITGSFYCNSNFLTSLEFGPKEVKGTFGCFKNDLTSLEFGPVKVDKSYYCEQNNLTSLEFCASKIGERLHCDRNQIAHLKNIHKQFKDGYIFLSLSLLDNPLKSHLLGVILIPQLKTHIYLDNKEVEVIINKHLKSERDVLECQEELIQNNFKEFAQL